MAPTASPWPKGAKAAVSFTMDNLGEAQDVNKWIWPVEKPVGQHFSVRQNLPRMLDLLDRHGGIKATYFAESWSLAVYADAVADMRARGHEIAWHGWQHETWKELDLTQEELNFARSFEAARKAGVTYEGFRPPGGEINERTWEMLRSHGFKYVSPLGEFGIKNGVVVLPFEWRGVDAFYYMDKFAAIRKTHGESEEVLAPSQFKEFVFNKLEEAKATGGYVSILFHPFLQTSEKKFAALEKVLQRIGADEDIWLAPCNQVADWVIDHKDLFRVETAST